MRRRRSGFFAVFVCCVLFSSWVLGQNLGDHAMEGFDFARTGLNTHMGDFKPPLKLVRTIELPGITGGSSLMVFEDYLLVGEVGDLIRWTLLDRGSETVRWTHELPGERRGIAAAYANDVALLGGSATTAVKAVRVSTGEELWSASNVGDPLLPILTNGLAIYGGEEKVVASDPVTGEVLWELSGDNDYRRISLFGNRVYIAGGSRYRPGLENLVYVADLRTGERLWTGKYETPLRAISPVIATEKYLFVIAWEPERPTDDSDTSLWALNTVDGELAWENRSFHLGNSLLLGYGQLYTLGGDYRQGRIGAYDATSGGGLWEVTEPGIDLPIPVPIGFYGFPMLANNVLYYVHFGDLQAIRARDVFDGACLWSIPMTKFLVDVALANEALYVLYEDKVEVYEDSHEIFFPHIADGAGQRTILAVSNLSSEVANGVVEFYDDSGEPLELDVEGSSGVSQVAFTIAPEGSARVETLGGVELQVGWARVDSDQPIAGSAVYQFSRQGEVLFEAGVSSTPVLGRAQVHVQRSGVFSTGIAVANPIQVDSEIDFTLLIEGEEVATAEMTLEPKGHLARLVEDLFPSVSSSELVGTVIVESDTPVAVTAVRTKEGYQMSSYPVGVR